MIASRRFIRTALLGVAVAALIATVTVLGTPAPARADWVRDDQWHLRALGAVAAWRHAAGAGVTVAVLDSGVDATHPDLAGQVLPGIDLVGGSTDGRVDPVGHGTSVAALIAGRRDDGAGVIGLAPDAKILPVRVLDGRNRYDDAAVVASGLRWAVDHGARVVNLSLGGVARSDALAEALAYAAARDVVVIACTGNVMPAAGGSHEVWYPAREPGVVAVAGLAGRPPPIGVQRGAAEEGAAVGGSGGSSDPLWTGSLTGPQTVLSAPAVNLLGARPGGYWRVQGTSFAAPLVAATATLVRSRYPGMSSANVINRLIRTARDLGAAGRDDRYGYGEVDPVGALTARVPTVAVNPLTTNAEPAAPAEVGVDPAAPVQSLHAVDDPQADGSARDADVSARATEPIANVPVATDLTAVRRIRPRTGPDALTSAAALVLVVAALVLLAAAATATDRHTLTRPTR